MSEMYEGYRETDKVSRTTTASPYQLVTLLFDGLLDELARTRGHLQARRFEAKGRSVEKCLAILNALNGALDHEQGGELVADLSRLYDYCITRLCEVSATLSLEGLDEVVYLLEQLREGWEGIDATRS